MTVTSGPVADLQALYAKATALFQDGKLDEALPLFGSIIQANPRIAEAQWQAAKIFCEVDDFPRALEHAAAAVRLRPKEPAVWATWADVVSLAGDKDAEREFLTEIRKAEIDMRIRLRLQDRFGSKRTTSRQELPGVPASQFDRIVQLMNTGQFEKATALAAAIHRAHPKSALASNVVGSALAAEGKTTKALQFFESAKQQDMFYAEAFMNAGRTLALLGKQEEAMKNLRAAIARAPDLELALNDYGSLLNGQLHGRRARHYLERLVKAHPNSVAGLISLGNTYTLLRLHERAVELLRKAVDLSHGKSVEALAMLSQALSHLGLDEESYQVNEQALKLKPDFLMAIGRKASLLQHLGQFDASEEYYKIVMERSPTDGEAFRGYMTSHKATPDDPIIPLMEERIKDPSLSDRSRMGFAFALSKGLEDIKRHDDAFPYIQLGNTLTRKLYPYDIKERYTEIADLMDAYRGFDWGGTVVPDQSEAMPIFVTGMPRSGTTLIEQIISSHSRVTGGGELGLLPPVARKMVLGANEDDSVSRKLDTVALSQIAELGHNFMRQVADRFPGADIVTDKSITTYLHLGLVKLALPKARIVVVRRDPRDNLLSIYKNRFPEGTHPYAYDLRDLAHYYATFVEMIDFWRSETPDWFTEIQYETLVANPEEESRRLIANCGLEWEDACLNFHENTRKVNTLSVYQVRQPISGGSVKAWQRYEAELAPMIEILQERGLLPD